jgi:hypothetical protein
MAGWDFPSERIGPRLLESEEETRRPEEELAALVKRSSVLVEQIRQQRHDTTRRVRDEHDRLRAELESSRAEVDALADMMARLERRSAQLTSLYVATFQLYAGRDPDQVYETIAEITSDILGAKRFALLMRDGDAPRCRIVLRHGAHGEPWEARGEPRAAHGEPRGTHGEPCQALGEMFGGESYGGGQPEVDEALIRGTRWVQPDPNGLVAVVPLKVDQTILGALVILDLLDHKPRLDDADSEILDLLGAHAASALLSSMNLSSTLRKLQTMTSLFRLVIGDTEAQ